MFSLIETERKKEIENKRNEDKNRIKIVFWFREKFKREFKKEKKIKFFFKKNNFVPYIFSRVEGKKKKEKI